MPDYNRGAALYWWLAVLLGTGILVVVLRRVLSLPAADLTVVLAGVAMAMLAAVFPVRILRWKNAFTAGEIFIFLLLLLQGPAAATLAAAAEALLGSWRTSKRWTSRLASPAMASMAMFGVASALHAGLAALQARGLDNPGWLLLAMMLGAAAYFLLNTLLITAVFHLKRGVWPAARELFGNFGWIGHHLCRQRLGRQPAVPEFPGLRHRCPDGGHTDHRPAAADPALLLAPAGGRRGCAHRSRRSKPLNAKRSWPPAMWSNFGPASNASTAPSRTPRSAWPWWVSTPASCRPTAALRRPAGPGKREEELEAQALIDFVDASDRAAAC
jgi:hypothetical protein